MNVGWIEHFEGLGDLEPDWRQVLLDQARVLSIPVDTELFAPEKMSENMIFLLNGIVRVQQVSEEGREIVLYRIEAGQGCIMSASCLSGDQEFLAQGIAETELDAVIIPKSVFDEIIAKSACFRNFVFSTFSKRLVELMMIINEVAFRRLDVRLAKKLTELSRNENEIRITHQKLGTELGTAREVVSRQLQEFQRFGWIEQSRGKVSITNRNALDEVAAKQA